MKKIKSLYLFFTFLITFSFSHVNAEIVGNYDTDNYTYTKSILFRVNEERYLNHISMDNLNFINDYFNKNYSNNENKYLLSVNLEKYLSNLNNHIVTLGLYDSSDGEDFGASQTYNFYSSFHVSHCFNFDLNNNNIENVECGVDFFPFYLTGISGLNGFILWTNKNYVWSDFIPKSFNNRLIYVSKNYLPSERYTKYYDYNIVYEYSEPVYTLMDLVGINTTKPSNKVQTLYNYKINYYFDGSLDVGKTENGTGEIGTVISEFTDYSSDFYYLDNTKNYSLTISSNEEQNVLNIYYKSYKKASYKIEYYFDDILKNSYTEIKENFVGIEINEFTDYSSDYWTLVENDYSITIEENSDLNILRIYYHSKNYGTEYQTIDTRNSKIPFIFQFADIKEFFAGVNFDIFTQSEQLQITIFINMWFVAMFTFISWLFLKIIYKVFQLFR